MTDHTRNSSGNGCLVLLGLAGVGLLGLGAAWELLPGMFDGVFADKPPPSRGVALGEPAPAPPPAPPAAPPPPAPGVTPPIDTTPVLWHAELTAHPTRDAGAPCAVVLDLVRRLDGPAARWAAVRCGDATLFEGPVERGALTEVSLGAPDRAYRAEVTARGEGATGDATLRLDTGRRRGVITARGGAVELFVTDLSAPRRGEPFRSDTVTRRLVPLRREAALTRTRGTVPAAVEAGPCRLRVDPTPSGDFNCRVLLRCGAAVVYGAETSGYNQCVLDGERVVRAEDGGFSRVDTDPSITLDVDAEQLVVSDESDDGVWEATFRLRPPAYCDDAGPRPNLGGQLFGDPPQRTSLRQATDGWILGGATSDGRFVAEDDGACDRGALTLSNGASTLRLTRGLRGEGLGGTWLGPDGAPRAALFTPR